MGTAAPDPILGGGAGEAEAELLDAGGEIGGERGRGEEGGGGGAGGAEKTLGGGTAATGFLGQIVAEFGFGKSGQ